MFCFPSPLSSLAENRLCYKQAVSLPQIFGESNDELDLGHFDELEQMMIAKRAAALEKLELRGLFPDDQILTLNDLIRQKIPLIDVPIERLNEYEAAALFGDELSLSQLIARKKYMAKIIKEREKILEKLGIAGKVSAKQPLVMNDLIRQGIFTRDLPFGELNHHEKKVLLGDGARWKEEKGDKMTGNIWAIRHSQQSEAEKESLRQLGEFRKKQRKILGGGKA